MYNFSSVSKHRNLLLGIAAFWVAWFHSYDVDFSAVKALVFLNIGSLLECLKLIGNSGVDIFLFLSGIGLYFSFSNNPDVPSFYRRRFLRIIPTSFVVAFIITILSPIKSIWHFLARITFIDYFIIKSDSNPFWYISAIILLYLLFPLFYKLIGKFKIWGAAVIVVVSVIIFVLLYFVDYDYLYQIEMLLARIPVFVAGILIAPLVKKGYEISNVKALIICLSGILYFPLLFILMGALPGNLRFAKHYLYCPLAVFVVFIITFICSHVKLSFLTKPFEFLGLYSLEFYLIHPMLYIYMSDKIGFFKEHQIFYAITAMAVSLLLAIILKYVIKKITDVTGITKSENSAEAGSGGRK